MNGCTAAGALRPESDSGATAQHHDADGDGGRADAQPDETKRRSGRRLVVEVAYLLLKGLRVDARRRDAITLPAAFFVPPRPTAIASVKRTRRRR